MSLFYQIQNQILKKYIHHISFNQFFTNNNDFATVVPDGMTELVINLGSQYERKHGTSEVIKVKGSHFIGIKSSFCLVRPNNGMIAVSVRFKPGSVYLFTDVCLDETTDLVVDAELIFGRGIKQLEHEIGDLTGHKVIIEKIETFLLSKLLTNIRNQDFYTSIKHIYANPLFSRIEDIQPDTINYKRIDREFNRKLGLPPKLFMRIVKFNYASKLLYCCQNESLCQIAYEANYFDQAHFIRSFKEFAGILPKNYTHYRSPMFVINQDIINSQFTLRHAC